MEKYGTYDVYRNKTTAEIIRIPYTGKYDKSEESEESEKLAAVADTDVWEKLDEDPEDKVKA